jgi:hypothetical protein
LQKARQLGGGITKRHTTEPFKYGSVRCRRQSDSDRLSCLGDDSQHAAIYAVREVDPAAVNFLRCQVVLNLNLIVIRKKPMRAPRQYFIRILPTEQAYFLLRRI